MLKNIIAIMIAFAVLFVVPWPITALVVVGFVATAGFKKLIGKFKS